MFSMRIVEGAGSEQIDAFCAESESALIYGTRDYLALIGEETGASPYWLLVFKEDRIEGALPLFLKHGPLGPVVNSLPYFGSNGAAIVHAGNVPAKTALVQAFLSFCRSNEAVSSTLITNPLLQDQEFYEANLPHDFRDERIGQFTLLPSNPEPQALLKQFSDPRPRNVRKAQREHLEVRATQAKEALDFVCATHQENMAAIGGKRKRDEFFYSVPRFMPKESWNIFIASKDGEYVAALLLFYFNRTVEYFTPCIVPRFRGTQALSLLIFEAMQDAISRGFVRWNWGGTWLSQDGVYAFKKKWGTRDLRYFYFTRLHDRSILTATREEIERGYPGFFVLPFRALAA
jgi:hypothetical protein